MTTGKFSAAEWKQLVNAPQLIYRLLAETDPGTIFMKRSEAKALDKYLSGTQSKSALVQSIVAGQKDADDKIKASAEEAEGMLRQVGALLEAKSDDVEGDAARDFLMDAAKAIAEAARENVLKGEPVSDKEQETLNTIASALKATEADKRRRHEAAAAAEAKERAEAEQKAEAARQWQQAQAKKKADEAKAKAEAEAKAKAEADAKYKAAMAKAKAEADAKKAAEAKAEVDAKYKAAMAKAKAEADAKKAAEEKAKAEAEAKAAEAAKDATIYVVKPGDTLSGISKTVYGNAGRWREIFEANKDIIENPNLIRPGWKLRIPR